MKNTETQRNAWIGLVEVRELPGNNTLGDARGAFVNILVLCKSKRQFVERSISCLVECGFEAIDYSDVEPLESWVLKYELDSNLRDLVTQLSDENPVQFDEFQTYPIDE